MGSGGTPAGRPGGDDLLTNVSLAEDKLPGDANTPLSSDIVFATEVAEAASTPTAARKPDGASSPSPCGRAAVYCKSTLAACASTGCDGASRDTAVSHWKTV